MVTGCVSSKLVHECEGESACGFYGLPHVLCVPVPPYAEQRDAASEAPCVSATEDALKVSVSLHSES